MILFLVYVAIPSQDTLACLNSLNIAPITQTAETVDDLFQIYDCSVCPKNRKKWICLSNSNTLELHKGYCTFTEAQRMAILHAQYVLSGMFC